MHQIDKIRLQCLQTMENQYATRIERLIDEQLLEEAESIIHEMTVTEEDFLHDDLFLDDLTEWTEKELKGIYFTDLEDIDIDNG
mgnify:FL=1|tara:strand:+ start:85 stop:336 length:252 start_codon:yes stop_codon:yes gene_type:complete